jgi:hypothetical protein
MSSTSLGKYFNGVTVAVVREASRMGEGAHRHAGRGYELRAFLRLDAAPGVCPRLTDRHGEPHIRRRLNLREKPSIHRPPWAVCGRHGGAGLG